MIVKSNLELTTKFERERIQKDYKICQDDLIKVVKGQYATCKKDLQEAKKTIFTLKESYQNMKETQVNFVIDGAALFINKTTLQRDLLTSERSRQRNAAFLN